MVRIDDFENQVPCIKLYSDYSKHPGKPVETFCLDHRQLGCSLCVPTEHNGCKSIRSLDDIDQRFATDRTVSCLPELPAMKSFSDLVESHRDRLNDEYKDMSCSMDILIKRAISKINCLHNEFKQTIKEKGAAREEQFQHIKTGSSMLQTDFENCDKILIAMRGRVSPKDHFLIQEQVKVQLSSHYDEMSCTFKKHRGNQTDKSTRRFVEGNPPRSKCHWRRRSFRNGLVKNGQRHHHSEKETRAIYNGGFRHAGIRYSAVCGGHERGRRSDGGVI